MLQDVISYNGFGNSSFEIFLLNEGVINFDFISYNE